VSIIAFTCRFISPFHTAGERYSNVQVCAPYVLGSTLRGAMLSQIIQRLCPEEPFGQLLEDNPAYHARCPGPCGAQALFDGKQTRFSFGEFRPEARARIFRSRVAIDRERLSVAEGALLQLDAVPGCREEGKDGADSRFIFEVETPSEGLIPTVVEAAEWAGDAGIGAFRNEGYGRFVVEKHPVSSGEPDSPGWPAGELYLEARTPYVLGKLSFGEEAFRRDLGAIFDNDWCDAHLGPVSVATVNLGYIGRWCYEDGKRHVRAVALPGSALKVTFKQGVCPDDVHRLLRGIGEWENTGFGRWRVREPDE